MRERLTSKRPPGWSAFHRDPRGWLRAFLVAMNLLGGGFALGWIFCDAAHAAPLSAHARQDSLYGGTRAEVRVYATVKAKQAGRATITLDALDTSHGNWGSVGQPTTAHVRLHKGINRIYRTLTAEHLVPRFCAYRPELAGDHPECPRLASFHDPYVLVPVRFDRVLVRIWVRQRRVAGVVSLAKSNAPAAPKRPGAGHGGMEPQ